MFRVGKAWLSFLLLLSCLANSMSKEEAIACAWFVIGSALRKKTLMDVRWSFYKKLKMQSQKCYVFEIDKNLPLNYTKTESQIWKAGFTVNSIENGRDPDVVLTICKDKTILCIAENKIEPFLEKFPIVSKETIQSKQEQSTVQCIITAKDEETATKKFLVLKSLGNGDSEQAKTLLEQFSPKELLSPELIRRCLAASMLPKDSKKLSESLTTLQKFGISVKSLPENEIKQLLLLILHDDENTQNGLLQPLLSNYNANEPDKTKVFEMTNKLCTIKHPAQHNKDFLK